MEKKKKAKEQSSHPRSRRGLAKSGYVIGVDGGGTKTIAALANLDGKILKLAKTGPSNLRNVGIEKAVQNIVLAIKKVLPEKGKISSTFIGLAAVEEEYKLKKEKIKKEILKGLKDFEGRLKIGSDQIIAFRAGSDRKNGLVLISGTGCVAHGWRGRKEAKVSGWGWLDDEGSGFWVGQKGFRAIFKELDGRGPKTKISKLIFKEWKLKRKEDLLKKIYSKDSVLQTSLISKVVDQAAREKDKIAVSIMREAGEKLAQSAIFVIKKLNFQSQRFPLVLVGRMFESKIVLNTVKKEIKKIAPRAQFIWPKIKPVIGAVKLAIENLEQKKGN